MNALALLVAVGICTVLAGLWCVVIGWTARIASPAAVPRDRTRLWSWMTNPVTLRRATVGVVAALVVLAVTHWPVAALASGVATVAIPRLVTQGAAAHRIVRLEALEQWTRRLADLLVAGRGLEQAIEHSAGRNLPASIEQPVTLLARRITVMRMPAEQALRLFADELNDPIADRIAAALILVARRRGAGAAAVLSGLAELVARDVADRREVEAARAEHRTTVRWIIAILCVLTTAAVLQRSYVAPFGTPVGQLALAFVALCYSGAFWWLHRLGIPEHGHRFLAKPAKEEP